MTRHQGEEGWGVLRGVWHYYRRPAGALFATAYCGLRRRTRLTPGVEPAAGDGCAHCALRWVEDHLAQLHAL